MFFQEFFTLYPYLSWLYAGLEDDELYFLYSLFHSRSNFLSIPILSYFTCISINLYLLWSQLQNGSSTFCLISFCFSFTLCTFSLLDLQPSVSFIIFSPAFISILFYFYLYVVENGWSSYHSFSLSLPDFNIYWYSSNLFPNAFPRI